MSKNEGGTAFPWNGDMCGGMTLRDYIATHALSGLLASPEGPPYECETIEKIQAHYAKVAYGYADAMLAERDR